MRVNGRAGIRGDAAVAVEDRRLAALREYHILDTEAELSFDRLTRAAADVCEAPMALVSLVDQHRQWFKSNIGIPATETPRDISFCAHAILHDELMVVRDASVDPRFAHNPLVLADNGIRFYAGAPLCNPDGYRIGTLCVLDRTARNNGLTAIQARVLQTLAAQVVAEFELRRTLTRMHWLAHHDTLTQLPNRLHFHERLNDLLVLVKTESPPVRLGVALLDLDQFKQVNDVYGHEAGDALLCHVASILADFIRPEEMAARLGGDEFILVLPDCGDNDAITGRIAALTERLREPFRFGSHLLHGGASIGVACSPDQGRDAGTLLKHADIAMYRAKAAGRGQAWMYHPDLGADIERKVDTFRAVRAAIRNGDVFPYYQPQFDLNTGEIVGCEALVRFRDEAGILHLPKDIEDAFEDPDLGVGIGTCMLTRVVRDMREWLAAGIDVHHVSINASAVELRRPDHAEIVLDTLAKACIPPSRLQVEVTESVFVGRRSERIAATLRALSAAGVSIALDDFGTGFASLSHLKQFPVDIIKIDRSFVATLGENPVDITIVTAIIKLAANLGMDLVAEGVETKRQAAILKSIGCATVQGFHFARAMPANEFASMWRTLAAARAVSRVADIGRPNGAVCLQDNDPVEKLRAI